jgi:amino acid transporter
MLPRRLGFWPATAVTIGVIIGSGIFRVPAVVAGDVGSVTGVAAVWILGGIITLCGALSLAELAAAFPRSGGVFVYLHEVYGPGVAFLFGWTLFFLSPAGIAAIALVFAEYLGTLVPLSPNGIRLVAAGLLVILAVACYRSVRGTGALVSAATAAKVAALAALVLAALLLGDGSAGSFGGGAPAGSAHLGGIGLGLVAALWAYNGIQDMVPIAGEVRDPGRVLPRALLLGITVVIVIYLSANAAYLYVLPYDALRASPLVASETAVRVLGTAGADAVAVAVMISTFGAVNGLLLTQPRIFYAMAREGLLFTRLADVHPRYATPHVAVVAYTAIAVVCVWLRSFEQLAEAFVLGMWPFLALAAIGVIILRKRRPELERPYRTLGYPMVPLIFVAGTFWVVGSALLARPLTTLAGIALTLAGIPVYLLRRRAGRVDAAGSSPESP